MGGEARYGTRVAHRFYPEARHELLDEINRDEVHRGILDWLQRGL
jgi:alpha-beta hydrolase superfamily lysophospholipase